MRTAAPSAAVPSLRLWGSIVAAFVLSLVVLVAGAYLWVFIYSVTIHTTGDAAYYEAYAQTASPVVAAALAFPVFYGVGRFMLRFGAKAWFAAFAVVAINLVMDAAVVATVAAASPHLVVMSVLAAIGKLAGAYAGTHPGVTR